MGLPGSSPFTYPPEWEMYDLETDPDELNNIYLNPSYRVLREELTMRMWELQAKLLDKPHHTQAKPTRVRCAEQ